MNVARSTLLCCLLLVCQPVWSESMNPDTDKTVSINDTVFISAPELEKLKNKADQGDRQAASTVAMYYLFYEYNQEEGMRWQIKAAESGDAQAQHDLAHFFFDEYRYQKTAGNLLDEAEKWARQAKQNGMPVDELLRDIDREKHKQNKTE